MTTQIDRRAALGALGGVSLAALLAACGKDDGGSGAAGSTTTGPTTSAEVPTTLGTTTTVSPQSAGGGDLAARFDAFATCSVTRELTEGPYYFDVDSIRSDIREDREGTPLRLAIRVRDAGECTPLADAVVDIWHCDALGTYSGFESASQGGPGGGSGPTDDETYLRGAQVTDADGIVQFMTVYPGGYRGRTVHIHAKVHLDRTTLVTTQLFFDEDVSEAVFAEAPYASDGGRNTFNEDDSIFDQSLVLTTSEDADGWLGLINFDVEA